MLRPFQCQRVDSCQKERWPLTTTGPYSILHSSTTLLWLSSINHWCLCWEEGRKRRDGMRGEERGAGSAPDCLLRDASSPWMQGRFTPEVKFTIKPYLMMFLRDVSISNQWATFNVQVGHMTWKVWVRALKSHKKSVFVSMFYLYCWGTCSGSYNDWF